MSGRGNGVGMDREKALWALSWEEGIGVTPHKFPHQTSVSFSTTWARWHHEWLLCTGRSLGQTQDKVSTCQISSNPHNNPVKQMLLPPPYRWGN